MILLTRIYRFAASHRLHSPALSVEENAALYGKCNNPHGHGHDYVLEVSVRGPLNPFSGRVVKVPVLDRLVESEVLSKLRHRDLNSEAAEIAGPVPTTESLAIGVRGVLAARWSRAFPAGTPKLDRVRVRETRKNIFEVPKLK